jgi:hypothetical protein
MTRRECVVVRLRGARAELRALRLAEAEEREHVARCNVEARARARTHAHAHAHVTRTTRSRAAACAMCVLTWRRAAQLLRCRAAVEDGDEVDDEALSQEYRRAAERSSARARRRSFVAASVFFVLLC